MCSFKYLQFQVVEIVFLRLFARANWKSSFYASVPWSVQFQVITASSNCNIVSWAILRFDNFNFMGSN